MSQQISELFSHPDTHRDSTSGTRRDEQRSYTDLFREPEVEVPQQGDGTSC